MWWPLLFLHRHRDSVFHTPATRINNSSPFCELEPLSAHSPNSIPLGQGLVKLWSCGASSAASGRAEAQLCWKESEHSCSAIAPQSVSVRNTNYSSRYFVRISSISEYFHPRQGWKSPFHCQMSAANPILTISQGRVGTALQYCISAHQKASMTI